jgi:oxalate decarboxylase/phosphoglucose isomerase-like protein (cupin superfamily)
VLAFDFFVAPGGGVFDVHCHEMQSEMFRCTSGELTVSVGGEEMVLRPGDVATIPAGVSHSLRNVGDVEVACEVEYRPAGRNREWFQLISAYQAKTGKEPGLLDLGAFLGDVGLYLDKPPVPVQKAFFAVLRPVARLLGRRRRMVTYAREVYGPGFSW